MTATPPSIQPLTAEELAALRQTHVMWLARPTHCRWCNAPWPCTIARLLAMIHDQETCMEVVQDAGYEIFRD